MAARSRAVTAEAQLRDHALALPEATEHFPWGERAIKVKGKVFLFMRADATQLSLSTKLPHSSTVALMLPFAEPTGYGLGKAGWVSARFDATDHPPIDMLCAWIDESYQAVAPAKLAARARDGGPPQLPAPHAVPRTPATRKPGSATRKPAPATRKPAPATRKPGPATRKPGPATRKPGPATRKPGAVAPPTSAARTSRATRKPGAVAPPTSAARTSRATRKPPKASA